jgi:hypothetical protein
LQKVERLNGIATVGNERVLCTFTLVYTGLKLDLKRSKALKCSKMKKTVRKLKFTVNGAKMVFTFTLTISKKGKLTLSKPTNIQPLTTTTPIRTPTITTIKTITPTTITTPTG